MSFCEGQAPDDLEHQARKPVITCRQPATYQVYSRFVIPFQPAPKRVGKHLFRETPGEVIPIGFQNLLELLGSAECPAAGKRARGIHWEFSILCSPTAYSVISFQAEPERVHTGVAGRAGGAGAVLFELLAQRCSGTDGSFV
jgi:hypothetical protein